MQIKLFDCRLLQRGSVQSYAGHVNSHTRLQLGVNPSETFLISGTLSFGWYWVISHSSRGQLPTTSWQVGRTAFCAYGASRTVSLYLGRKSRTRYSQRFAGQKLEMSLMVVLPPPCKILVSNIYDVCLFTAIIFFIAGKQKSRKQLECCSEYSYFPTHSWGTWLGSPDGLFYMHGT